MASTTSRKTFALIHRYVGLTIACFLLITAATGVILSWYDELDALAWSAVAQVEPGVPGAKPLDPLEIRERVMARVPNVSPDFTQLDKGPGQPLLFDLVPNEHDGGDNELWVNPYTGEETGRREWGNIAQGTKNLLPFIFRFHRSLALDSIGETILAIVAMLWILNCLTGAYLTLPPARPIIKRWQAAWLIDRKRLSYDLHRASGLWLWSVMLVLAWSAVSFNLSEVYSPVTRALFEYRDYYSEVQDLAQPEPKPALSFADSRDRGRVLAKEHGEHEAFRVLREDALSYVPEKGLYRYRITTDRDVWKEGGASEIWFDASTGKLLALMFPTQQSSGNTVTTWLQGLHRARVGGVAYQLFLSLVGIVILAMTVAGVVVWWRKRMSRLRGRRARRHGAAQ